MKAMRPNRRLNRKAMTACFAVFSVAALVAVTVARSNEEKKRMINKSTPVLHVKAVEPSLKFWTERFGFKKTVEVPEGDHLGFIALEKGAIEVMYQTYFGMKADPANPL